MTDPITTPAQMREAAARCCEAEADKCDDAAKWGGSKRYVSDCKAAAYAMLDRAAAIRALPVAEPAPTHEAVESAVKTERERMLSWCAKRNAVSRKAWERAARKALTGDMAELRNRIDMIDAEPLEIALSDEAGLTSSPVDVSQSADPAAEAAPVAVKVKPLEWVRVHTYAQDVFDAIGAGMVYRIIPQDGHFWLTVPGVDNKYPTIDAANDAANADNEARVLSQIDAVPAAQVRAAALEEAAKLPPYDSDGDPAGSFDHHVFVKRDAIRALIKREPT